MSLFWTAGESLLFFVPWWAIETCVVIVSTVWVGVVSWGRCRGNTCSILFTNMAAMAMKRHVRTKLRQRVESNRKAKWTNKTWCRVALIGTSALVSQIVALRSTIASLLFILDSSSHLFCPQLRTGRLKRPMHTQTYSSSDPRCPMPSFEVPTASRGNVQRECEGTKLEPMNKLRGQQSTEFKSNSPPTRRLYVPLDLGDLCQELGRWRS